LRLESIFGSEFLRRININLVRTVEAVETGNIICVFTARPRSNPASAGGLINTQRESSSDHVFIIVIIIISHPRPPHTLLGGAHVVPLSLPRSHARLKQTSPPPEITDLGASQPMGQPTG
jgi:hypothetical protein